MSSSVHSPGPVPDTEARQRDPIKAVPVPHWGQWVSAVVVLALVAALIYSVATNDKLQWSEVREFLFESSVLDGLWVTIQLTVFAMVAGIALGIVLAVMRLSQNPVLRTVGLVLHLALPRHAGPRSAADLVQPGAVLPADRGRLLERRHQRPGQAVRRCPARSRAQRGGVHGRGRPWRHPRRRSWSERGVCCAGHDPGPDHAPDRAAPGDARHHSARPATRRSRCSRPRRWCWWWARATC